MASLMVSIIQLWLHSKLILPLALLYVPKDGSVELQHQGLLCHCVIESNELHSVPMTWIGPQMIRIGRFGQMRRSLQVAHTAVYRLQGKKEKNEVRHAYERCLVKQDWYSGSVSLAKNKGPCVIWDRGDWGNINSISYCERILPLVDGWLRLHPELLFM